MKPTLLIRNDDLPATARELADLIAKSGRVFERGGPVKVHTLGHGLPIVEPLTPDRVVVEAHALIQPITQSDQPKRVTLPHRAARLYLALENRGLMPLTGIASSPLLTSDGSIRVLEGYDKETGLWCSSVPVVAVPLVPTNADARAALNALRAAVHTFPFADAAKVQGSDGLPLINLGEPPRQDESAFLVGLLTAVCRASLVLAPGLVIRAPSITGAGSGKGQLVRAVSAVAFGTAPQAFTAGSNEEELDKRLASALMEATPILFLDNANARCVKSDLLAAVLSEPLVGVRRLGSSSVVKLNTRSFVVITGNGVSVSEDLVRRFLICELDAGMEDPERRPFPPGFVWGIEARRIELLSAALTIWRWGRQNAGAISRGRPLGSYEVWCEWVRDPLLTLGCADPAERIAEIKARDPARARIAEFFTAWWRVHSDTPVKAAEISPDVLASMELERNTRQFIASALDRLSNTRTAGFVLTRQTAGGRWSAATYRLRRTDAQLSDESDLAR